MNPARLLLCFSLLGCTSAPQPQTMLQHHGSPLPVDSPESLLRHVTRINDGYATLKTVHRVKLDLDLDGTVQRWRFRGILLIRRPDRFRLLILGPAGVKLADLISKAGAVHRVYLAQPGWSPKRLPTILDAIGADIQTIYRLNPPPSADGPTVTGPLSGANGRPLYRLRWFRAKQLVSQLDILAATAAVASSQDFGPSGLHRRVSFTAFERRDDLLLPRRIDLVRQGELSYALAIDVEAVDINPNFDTAVFEAR